MLALFVPKISEDEIEDLGSYLVRVSNRKNISLQQVADKAKRAGIKVERATLSKITSSAGGNPTLETLRGIAFGLEEPIQDVVAAAFNLNRNKQVTRQVTLRQLAWDALDKDAARCSRTPDEHLSAVVNALYNLSNVEIIGIKEVQEKVSQDEHDYQANLTGRTRGTVMREAKGEQRYTPEEILRILYEIQELGFQNVDMSVLDILADQAPADVDPALKEAVLSAVSKLEDPVLPKLKSGA